MPRQRRRRRRPRSAGASSTARCATSEPSGTYEPTPVHPSMKFMLFILTLSAIGCGYSHPGSEPGNSWYQWRSLYREDVRSVSIPVFKNRTYYRGVEFSLTKALANQIESRTPYKVVSDERADTMLYGEVVEVDIRTVSNDPRTAIPQEQLMGLRVNFTWKDLRTGQILTERRNFEQTNSFYPTLGESRFVGSQLAVERLALGIAQELQADW